MKDKTRSVNIVSFYCDGEMKDKIEAIIEEKHTIRNVKFNELIVGGGIDISNLTYRIRATKDEVKKLAKCLEYYGFTIAVNRKRTMIYLK